MSEHSIAPEPKSYSVWYHYLLANNKELNKEIELAIKKNVNFDNQTNEYLYDKFIESEALLGTQENQDNAKELLADILNIMNDFSGDNNVHQQKIDEHITKLKNVGGDNEEVNSLAEQIINSASALKDSSETLNSKLLKTKEEAEDLRKELVRKSNEAERDFLTGLYNRKALDKILDEMFLAASENHKDLCVMMIDIDHFGKLNNTHGHLIGDEVLKMIAKIMTDLLKGQDIVARYGGEEFMVLLPNTPVNGAMAVANNLRQTISDKKIKRRDTEEYIGDITVSIGVATYITGSDTIPVLVKRADDALFKAKTDGRNRAIMASG